MRYLIYAWATQVVSISDVNRWTSCTHFSRPHSCCIPCTSRLVLVDVIISHKNENYEAFHRAISFRLRLIFIYGCVKIQNSLFHVDGVRLSLWSAATNGPIVMPTWYMSMEIDGGMIQRKQKNSEKKLSQYHVVHHKSHMDWPGYEPRLARSEAGD
jgi:hypothetical protein